MTNPDLPVTPEDIAATALRQLQIEPGPEPIEQLSAINDEWIAIWGQLEDQYGHLDPNRPMLWPSKRICVRYIQTCRVVMICVNAFIQIQAAAQEYFAMRDLVDPLREAGE